LQIFKWSFDEMEYSLKEFKPSLLDNKISKTSVKNEVFDEISKIPQSKFPSRDWKIKLFIIMIILLLVIEGASILLLVLRINQLVMICSMLVFVIWPFFMLGVMNGIQVCSNNWERRFIVTRRDSINTILKRLNETQFIKLGLKWECGRFASFLVLKRILVCKTIPIEVDSRLFSLKGKELADYIYHPDVNLRKLKMDMEINQELRMIPAPVNVLLESRFESIIVDEEENPQLSLPKECENFSSAGDEVMLSDYSFNSYNNSAYLSVESRKNSLNESDLNLLNSRVQLHKKSDSMIPRGIPITSDAPIHIKNVTRDNSNKILKFNKISPV